MPPWAWRCTRGSCRDLYFVNCEYCFRSKELLSQITNHISSRRGIILGRCIDSPKIGVCPREGHSSFHRSAVLLAQPHDAAIHLPLRPLIGEQKCLPFAHGYTQ